MRLSRNQFFLILSLFLVSPFYVQKSFWLIKSRVAVGEMLFTGHGNLGSALGLSEYPVIRFAIGRDTQYFNGNMKLDLKPGQPVSVRYLPENPSDAKVNAFVCLWGDSLAYSLLPTLVLLVLYLHRGIIPRKTHIVLGRTPFFQLE
jgi:hypothetical protein